MRGPCASDARADVEFPDPPLATLGAFGFLFSKRTGMWTAAAAGAAVSALVACCFYLDVVMGR